MDYVGQTSPSGMSMCVSRSFYNICALVNGEISSGTQCLSKTNKSDAK